MTDEIVAEYQRVCDELSARHPSLDPSPFLSLLLREATRIKPFKVAENACVDPDDLKFLACARAARAKVLVSGDRHLIAASGYGGIIVETPRQFVEHYLETGAGG